MKPIHARQFAEAVVSLSMPQPRRSFAAQECADALEALDIGQVDESERQPWSPAYKDRVTAIIDSYMKAR